MCANLENDSMAITPFRKKGTLPKEIENREESTMISTLVSKVTK